MMTNSLSLSETLAYARKLPHLEQATASTTIGATDDARLAAIERGVGILFWETDGRIIEANDEFLHIVGYDREDIASGRLRWTDLTPPEWLDRDLLQCMPELKTTGNLQPFEREYSRKDGSRVSVLIGQASFEAGNKRVAFVLDLTGRKQAEADARASEERYREVQMELTHANRVATVGQLTTSIVHEVKQPIGAAVAYADAALRFLARRPPNLEKVREALEGIAEMSRRAGDVIDRIRTLMKKAPHRSERLDLNEAIHEVIELTSGETIKDGIAVQTDLAQGLPLIEGDRIELQQVILNLIMNAVESMSTVSDGARELLISTRNDEPGGVLVGVRDSGPGLSAATLERLFDPFYTTKPGGLGLGLSICRSIIEIHGGRLWATANVPRGAIFEFSIPASQGLDGDPRAHSPEMEETTATLGTENAQENVRSGG
jgi:PAS domain S-box-containing protein